MSTTSTFFLPPEVAAPMMRQQLDLVKNKAYQQYPIGREVKAYLADREYEGKSENTILADEQVLAWLAIDHLDLELAAFSGTAGTRLLSEFRTNRWGDASDNTKNQRHHILKAFFKWAKLTGRVRRDPVVAMKAPRKQQTTDRNALNRPTVTRLLDDGPQTSRERCALLIYVLLGLRKNELRLLRIQDIDLAADHIVIRHPKGGGDPHKQPIVFDQLRTALEELMWEAPHPDEHLLFPAGKPYKPMEQSTLHRWFKNCLDRAGLPDTIKLHELRHTAAHEVYQATGNIVAASKLLRHKSVATTETYLHPTEDDLRDALELTQARFASDPTEP